MCEILVIITYFIPLAISLIWFIHTLVQGLNSDRELTVGLVLIVFCMCTIPILNVVIAKDAITDLIEHWR